MSKECPTCGNPLLGPPRTTLSPGQLNALSAWWHMGTVKAAASLLSRSERTVINQLYKARIREGVHTTQELAQIHLPTLRSMSDLIRSHKNSMRRVA